MTKRLTIKNHQQESQLLNRRSVVAFCLVVSLFALLFFRLLYLQIIEHQKYSTLSQHNLLAVLPIEPNRGLIYDRNGILLAKNVPVFTLNIIPDKIKHMHQTIQALQTIIVLSDHEIKQFNRHLKQHRPYEPIPLKMNLSEKELAAFYVNRYRFPGVLVQTHLLRTYPAGKTMSHVIGYVSRINASKLKHMDSRHYGAASYAGKTGIENYYEKLLHGKMGFEEVEINANGNVIRHIKKMLPTPGNNLYLTIDSRLQVFAQQALGNKDGAIVAIQPRTGQVLALVTNPSFDPNQLVNGISHKNYALLSHASNHPLFNRAIHGQYSPGSTIKPFMAIAGLDSDIITTKSKIYDPGWFRLPNTTHIYHGWKHSGHGWVNVTKAIRVSCDTFFYQLSVRLGIHEMNKTLSQFGFGKPTKVDIPGEQSGLIPSPQWKRQHIGYPWYTGDTILSGIGQGFVLTTPLQLAEGISIIAEHGAHYQPHLLLAIQSPNDQILPMKTIERPPMTLKHPEIWDTIIQAMHSVISSPEGTAVGFGRNAQYTAAAKTGTTQVYRKKQHTLRNPKSIPKRLRNNHLFVVFAPVKNPQIALAVVIEHTSHADRIARKVLDFYFQHRTKDQYNKAKSHEL